MAIKVGDVEVANQILENEFRLANLEKILEFIANNNQGKIVVPNQVQLEQMRSLSLQQMKTKYPNMGLELKK